MSRRYVFGSLTGLVLLVNLGRVVFAPLVESLKAAFGAGNATIGLTVTLAWVGSALLRVPTGWLLTRIPRRTVVGATGVILAGASLFLSAATTVPLVMLGALCVGLASGAYFIAANPLVSELFPNRVGTALGVHGTASQVGAVVAPLTVTAALSVGTWRTVFHALAVAALLATVVFLAAARRTDLPDAGVEDRDLFGAVRAQWRIVATGVVVVATVGFVWQGVFNFYVTYLGTRGVGRASANLLLTGVFAAGIPAFAVTGWLADRVSVLRLVLAIVGGFAVCVLLVTAVSGVALVGASLLLGYVVHSLFPAIDTYLLGSLPDRHRASAYAAYSGTMMIFQASGSWAVGLATDAGVPFQTLYRALALGVGGVALALLVATRLGWVPAEAEA